MHDFSFESMGTLWQITADVDALPTAVISRIKKETNAFDQQYSRFIATSESNKFRNSVAGKYQVSPMLAEILTAAQHLFQLTDGAFDISIATLFEEVGYDPQYNFAKAPDKVNWKPPQWSIEGETITISGPIVFDIGGIGKGYWIDKISQILIQEGFTHHLVDGGGDMYGTTKADSAPWRIAIEYPGKTDTALGLVELKNQGLAISDVLKRKWKNWHHLINAKTNQPITQLLSNAALASTAFIADQMTSVLSFSDPNSYERIAKELHADYLIMKSDETLLASNTWPGELFT